MSAGDAPTFASWTVSRRATAMLVFSPAWVQVPIGDRRRGRDASPVADQAYGFLSLIGRIREKSTGAFAVGVGRPCPACRSSDAALADAVVSRYNSKGLVVPAFSPRDEAEICLKSDRMIAQLVYSTAVRKWICSATNYSAQGCR